MNFKALNLKACIFFGLFFSPCSFVYFTPGNQSSSYSSAERWQLYWLEDSQFYCHVVHRIKLALTRIQTSVHTETTLNLLPLPRRSPSAVFSFQGPAGLKGGEGPQGPPGPIVSNLFIRVTCSVVEMNTAETISDGSFRSEASVTISSRTLLTEYEGNNEIGVIFQLRQGIIDPLLPMTRSAAFITVA